MPMSEADAQLPLKKRARRRLVGAIALAVLAAVILPMIMDQTPQNIVHDVQIRIPGQDQVPPFNPKALAEKTTDTPAAKGAVADKLVVPTPQKSSEPADSNAGKTSSSKEEPKAVEKAAEKPVAKVPPVDDSKAKAAADEEAKRAAAILAGKAVTSEPAKTTAVEHVILIGAFANPANVKQLQTKLGELDIKVYTEILASPQGNKTRVRAGPFSSRDAAEKALEKMKRIGVNGIIATR